MRSSLLFGIVYQFLFALLSLAMAAAFDGYRGEMFAGACWFNVLYGVVGVGTNTSSIYFGKSIFKDNFIGLMTFQSIVIVLVMNLLFYFLDRSFVTISLFTADGDQFTISLFTHGLILVAVFASSLVYRRNYQKTEVRQ